MFMSHPVDRSLQIHLEGMRNKFLHDFLDIDF